MNLPSILYRTAVAAAKLNGMNSVLLPTGWLRRHIGLADDFVGNVGSVVDFAEGFDDRPGVDGHGAGLFVGVDEVPDERLDVAVEDDAHEFAAAVDDRAARIAADDVGRRDEIEAACRDRACPCA